MKGYAARVQRVLLVALALNLVIALGKLVAGWRADSLAVIGDGLHSGVDALANGVALVVLRFASQPADEDHPYGHQRYETLAAFVLGGLLFLTAFELARSAIERLVVPVATSVSPLTLGVMGTTLLVNVGLAWYEARAGRREKSEMLAADAAQARADVYVTLAVLLGLGLQSMGLPRVDPLVALGVAASIAWAGYHVYRDVMPVLTDRAVYDAHQIAKVVRSVEGVVSVHDIRSRGSVREPYVQMHLVVVRQDVAGAHAIADEVERRLAEELGVRESLVHIEPEDDASGPPGSRGDSPLDHANKG
ncbi:MAG TPA: cation diffusion facilitator family transporter [Candidatus Thermoplasmatota archaeon]|nr:cation diffusion facilitator family transporter [Candidatus Thermoplasmatota archaeon]